MQAVRHTLCAWRELSDSCADQVRLVRLSGIYEVQLPSSAHSLLCLSLVASALQPPHRPRLRRKRTWNVHSRLRLVAAHAIASCWQQVASMSACGSCGGRLRRRHTRLFSTWSGCIYFSSSDFMLSFRPCSKTAPANSAAAEDVPVPETKVATHRRYLTLPAQPLTRHTWAKNKCDCMPAGKTRIIHV